MKKNIVFVMFIVFFLAPQQVFAHTLKIDGTIGVILHVDPDDAPVAGIESKLFVEIQDKSGRFNVNNPENCDCRLSIVQKDKTIKTLAVTTGGTYNQLRYTFPISGVYHVVIQGKTNGKGLAFQSFRTDFEYFVKPGGSEFAVIQQENPLRAWTPYIAAAIGSAIILIFVL